MAGIPTKQLTKGMLKKIPVNGIMAAGFGVMDYNQNRAEGKSKVRSAAGALGEWAMFETLGFLPYMGLQAATAAPGLIGGAVNSMEQRTRMMSKQSVNKPFQNSTFVDTQQAYTMRQAGMQLAQNSKYNLQQTMMGNEAQYMK